MNTLSECGSLSWGVRAAVAWGAVLGVRRVHAAVGMLCWGRAVGLCVCADNHPGAIPFEIFCAESAQI
jgi:hypothetical protein